MRCYHPEQNCQRTECKKDSLKKDAIKNKMTKKSDGAQEATHIPCLSERMPKYLLPESSGTSGGSLTSDLCCPPRHVVQIGTNDGGINTYLTLLKALPSLIFNTSLYGSPSPRTAVDIQGSGGRAEVSTCLREQQE